MTLYPIALALKKSSRFFDELVIDFLLGGRGGEVGGVCMYLKTLRAV